ncbi:MAG: phosphopentomutase [Sporomusaceae bacterium]|nr:phosphopentomutase [Sporomusaceae bacterium]
MKFERIITIVLDSVGIGAAPDAARFGDQEAHTLGHIARSTGGLILPTLERFGLGCIATLEGVATEQEPLASYGKMQEISRGKDTTSGHWELMGCPVQKEFPVYPNGFPAEMIVAIEALIGRKILGNKAASGTEIIAELGEEHMKTGFPIIYTSADSVLQIAAHESVIPLEELYEFCHKIRTEICVGKNEVGRIIARPFIGSPGQFVRTPNRHDYSVEPVGKTVLDLLQEQNIPVIGVGKIGDIFAHRGISQSYPTKSNSHGMEELGRLVRETAGPCYIMANLVDFDSQYGHRRDPAGYKAALAQFDQELAVFLPLLKTDDLLLITADHGCDPTAPGSDHTREYVPILAYSPTLTGLSLGIRTSFADVGQTIAENFSVRTSVPGVSFLSLLGSKKS